MIPVTSTAVHEIDPKIEKENEQTGRFILGLMGTSFVMGILTTVFGYKNKDKLPPKTE